ncbi:MAG: hypothetical protein V1816_06105 [Pseudomonadota bacterium]
MTIELTLEERIGFLTIMAGAGHRALSEVYRDGDQGTRELVLSAMAKTMADLEPIMVLYGLDKDAAGLARAMVLTEDLIGCRPAGELVTATPAEAVRKVTSCPWAASFSADGSTCRLVMAALEKGLAEKYGLKVVCEQSLAEGAEYCIWKVIGKNT